MKKRLIILSLVITTAGLTTFGFMNCSNNPKEESIDLTTFNQVIELTQEEAVVELDFSYDVGPRFTGIRKGELEKANSIGDFLPNEPIADIVSYKSVKVIIVKDERPTNIVEMGFSNKLTEGQKKLLSSSDISTNFSVYADYMIRNKATGQLEANHFNPYLTIVPEKQAEYVDGKDNLLTYLIENSKESRGIVEYNKIRPAKLFFTVTKKGAISKVKIGNHSGYPSLDEKMIELVKQIPGEWIPAQNIKGEKVDQELVFSYGIGGC